MWPNSTKKNCDQTKKNNVTILKKVVTKLKNKTLQESRKAALRVGRLSSCWGDKRNSDNSKTQIVRKKKTKKIKMWKK